MTTLGYEMLEYRLGFIIIAEVLDPFIMVVVFIKTATACNSAEL